jgi:hypothetical protein
MAKTGKGIFGCFGITVQICTHAVGIFRSHFLGYERFIFFNTG